MTPNLFNFELWERSGHAEHYKDNMFLVDIEKQEFGLKPMNCPGTMLLHHWITAALLHNSSASETTLVRGLWGGHEMRLHRQVP